MSHKIEKIASCVCGCHIIKFEKWTDDEGAWLMIYENAFYSKQGGRVIAYLKRLWSAIRGKEYLLMEISMSDDDTVGLRNAIVEATTPLDWMPLPESSNDTQTETFVYGKDSKPLPCPFCGKLPYDDVLF